MTTVRHLVKGLGPGGAERLIVAQITAASSRVDHHAAYLVPAKNHLVPELRRAGVDPVCLDDSSGPGWVLRLRALMRDEPTDIVHVHSPAVAAAVRVVARTLPRSKRPVVVGTEHNRWPRHHRLTRFANRLTIRLEAATIAVSDDVASTVRGVRSGRLRTIIHGIDLDAVRATADRDGVRAELQLPDDAFVFVCVANLRKEKALDDLVAAAAMAVAERDDLHYVLVGQGPLADELDRWIAEAGVGRHVHAVGYRPDATRIVSAADVFTMSSHHEGLPVSVMEAFALGLPVVATAAGGIPSAVQEAGIVTPIGDPAALADAQLRVATDESLRRELAAQTATRAGEFSIQRAVAEIEAVYDAVTS